MEDENKRRAKEEKKRGQQGLVCVLIKILELRRDA